MASGYDISASTSTNTANNSAAGPATSGGVSVGNVTLGGTDSSGLFFSPPKGKGTNWTPLVIGALGLAAIAAGAWYLNKRKA